MHFFPERLLIFSAKGVGAVAYHDLEIQVEKVKFVESGKAPADSEVVGRTWKYVNKKGGPDRRFKDNVELPICLYEEMTFRSRTGLNERIQLSRGSVAGAVTRAVQGLVNRG